jgi:hypothetical protein
MPNMFCNGTQTPSTTSLNRRVLEYNNVSVLTPHSISLTLKLLDIAKLNLPLGS